ncbi:hypothetical protein FVEG_07595 [Fusarium verticillioides 7600]|uniref:C2H2-type domain-containing protein n=1 Tax=Gibberella moniliformis (strain M3125 / FGSC 7600) TaxID=334819 RepID=W7MIS0_GIBM7|nr:hypothetical protein FVEG_07595 [Fusarium verticillioides 7600]EWG47519.1 hypothetical protein FVEG_07595 [Fusarium verticillioides 7600]
MTLERSRKLPVRQFPRQSTQQCPQTGLKKTRSGRSLSPLDNQCKESELYEATALPRSEGSPSNDDDAIISTNEHLESQENIISCCQLSLKQKINLQQLLRERFGRWADGVEYTAPPKDRLPPRKRFRTSQWQSGLPRADEGSHSEEEFVIISHPTCRQGFFHLACPFYIHAPDKHQKCLVEQDLSSIEALIKHLLRQHDKPLYCRTCWKTFETLIDRDNHVLENACKRIDQEASIGLTESQKVRLIKRDRYELGEARRWRRLWSTVFPGREQPRSPYLDRDEGLKVSMVRDFWMVDGQKVVSGYLGGLGSHADGNNPFCNSVFG